MRRAFSLVVLLASGMSFAIACGGDDGDEPIGDSSDAGQESSTDTGNVTDTGTDQNASKPDAGEAGDGGPSGTNLDGGACGGNAVTLTSVFPQFAWKDGTTALTLTGTGFIATPKVYLRSSNGTLTQLQHVAFVSSTSISVVVPAGVFTAGVYEVAVVNANTCAGTLVSGLRILDEAPPSVLDVSPGAGTNQNDVPVTITGCNFKTDATVSVVSSNGTVTLSANSAPTCNGANDARCNNTPLCTMSATIQTKTDNLASGAYLVRVTNVAQNAFGDWATFVVTNPAGNLGTWVASSPLVTGRRSLALTSGRVNDAARFLYAVGGENAAGTALKTVEVGPIDRFGEIGKWFVQKNELVKARSGASVVRHNQWLYVIGGTESTNGTGGVTPTGTALASVERAKILDPAGAPKVASPPQVDTTTGTLAKGTWYYRVSAVGGNTDDPGGESLGSEEVVATLSTNGNVKLQWSTVAGATEYRIYRSATPDATSDSEVYLATVTVTADAGASTSFVDDGSVTIAGNAVSYMRVGSTGKWVDLGNLIGDGGVGRFNASATMAFTPAGDHVAYVTGGWGRCIGGTGSTLVGCVEYAKINNDGTVNPFALGAPLAFKRMRHGSAVVDKDTGGVGHADAGSPTTAYLVVSGGKGEIDFGNAQNVEWSLVGQPNGAFANPGGFGNKRDGSQLLVANGYAYAFFGGVVDNNVNYTATGDQSELVIAGSNLTFPSWNNAGGNLGGANKVGRHGMTAESAYFYLVGGTSNDTDALTTVWRILH